MIFFQMSLFMFLFLAIVVVDSNDVKVSDANKSDVEKGLADENIEVERDRTECNHAIALLRTRIGLKPLLANDTLHIHAEKWAIYLASKVNQNQNILQSQEEKLFGYKYGELLYYAEDLTQAPGCNMAAVAWLRKLNKNDGPLNHTKAIGGDFNSLLWKGTLEYGFGLSYNKKRRSGFIVAYFHPSVPKTEEITALQHNNDKVSEEWEFLLPGLRNAHLKPISFETNLGHMVCYSRDRHCDEWAAGGQCKVPSLSGWMMKNCHRSCIGCVRGDTPIDGGWSNWAQVTPCSKTCGGGIILYYRFCKMPPVMNRGKDCEGPRVRRTHCNTLKCDQSQRRCIDQDVDCGLQKQYCEDKVHGSWMNMFCRKTCNACTN